MKIGITGAAGYIGSRVMYDAIKLGHEVVGIDNFYSGQINEIKENKIINVNIENLKEIKPLLQNCDVIIHLAAITGIVECKEKPDLAFKTNILGTENITWICYKHHIPLIFVSSMAVYGNPKKFPIKENDPKKPTNFYGLTKLIGMKNVQFFSENNFPVHIFILSNVYGNHTIDTKTITKRTVVNKFVNQAKENKALTVYKPGTQSRDFIHVNDVSRIILASVEIKEKDEKKTKFYNLASGKSYSVLEIARIIRKIAIKRGYKTRIKIVDNPRKNDILSKTFDVSIAKIKKDLDLKPDIDIKNAISGMI